MQYWFSADFHLNHKNILRYTNRPFKNINEMNYVLIKNWNSRVKAEDTVFFLGDFAFVKNKQEIDYFRNQLIGKIIFLRGNHDNGCFKPCIHDISIYLGGKHLLLVHRPEESAYGYDLCLVGHVHQHYKFQTLKFKKYPAWDVCNVGVDVWSGMPITINEIFKEYKVWKRTRTGIQDLGNWHLSEKKTVISKDAPVDINEILLAVDKFKRDNKNG